MVDEHRQRWYNQWDIVTSKAKIKQEHQQFTTESG